MKITGNLPGLTASFRNEEESKKLKEIESFIIEYIHDSLGINMKDHVRVNYIKTDKTQHENHEGEIVSTYFTTIINITLPCVLFLPEKPNFLGKKIDPDVFPLTKEEYMHAAKLHDATNNFEIKTDLVYAIDYDLKKTAFERKSKQQKEFKNHIENLRWFQTKLGWTDGSFTTYQTIDIFTLDTLTPLQDQEELKKGLWNALMRPDIRTSNSDLKT